MKVTIMNFLLLNFYNLLFVKLSLVWKIEILHIVFLVSQRVVMRTRKEDTL